MEDLNARAGLRRDLASRLGRKFSAEVNDLADVMVGVSGAAQDDSEPILFLAALRGIGGALSLWRLFANRVDDQVNRAVKIAHDLVLGRASCFCKFAIAVAEVTGRCDSRRCTN